MGGEVKAAQNSILLVDNSPLRRAALHSFLLGWLKNSDTSVLDFDVPDASDHLEVDDAQQLILLSVGGSSLEDTQNKQSVRMLRGVAPDIPLAIIGEREDADETLAALRLGAAAYLPTSLDTEFAVHCLDFLKHGGSYFPPMALQAAVERYSGETGGPGNRGRNPSPGKESDGAGKSTSGRQKKESAGAIDIHTEKLRRDNDEPSARAVGVTALRNGRAILEPRIFHPCERERGAIERVEARAVKAQPAETAPARMETAEVNRAAQEREPEPAPAPEAKEALTPAETRMKEQIASLTSRQQEVLRLLMKGAANKQIARKLSMTESTVKVHVHQIIKKFGVNNRTEVVAELYQGSNVLEKLT